MSLFITPSTKKTRVHRALLQAPHSHVHRALLQAPHSHVHRALLQAPHDARHVQQHPMLHALIQQPGTPRVQR